jgi:hypothetical protein
MVKDSPPSAGAKSAAAASAAGLDSASLVVFANQPVQHAGIALKECRVAARVNDTLLLQASRNVDPKLLQIVCDRAGSAQSGSSGVAIAGS